MAEYLQVTTTFSKREEADTIAKALVEARLAGCVQVIGPITSTYWWKGKIEVAEEWLCIAKTTKALYTRLEACIRQMHSYEVPEIMALPVSMSSEDYSRWLDKELTSCS